MSTERENLVSSSKLAVLAIVWLVAGGILLALTLADFAEKGLMTKLLVIISTSTGWAASGWLWTGRVMAISPGW